MNELAPAGAEESKSGSPRRISAGCGGCANVALSAKETQHAKNSKGLV